MALAIRRLELMTGKTICLHIPRASHADAPALEAELLRLAAREGKMAVVCRPAVGRQGVFGRLREQTAQQWLAKAAGISLEQSRRMIAGFGVPVADALSANAAMPRCLLGMAAVLVRKPAVLVYSTAGLDPRGCLAVHQYAAAHGNALCLVHLSLATLHGDVTPAPRNCPASAKCITLSEN